MKEKLLFKSYHSDYKPSPTEQRIFSTLIKLKLPFKREVEFEKLKGYRFDFYLFLHNIVIEYDGKDHKTNERVKVNDKIKTSFCFENNVKIYRFDTQNYHNLEQQIKELAVIKGLKPIRNKGKVKNWLILEAEGWTLYHDKYNDRWKATHKNKGIYYHHNKGTLLWMISQK